jgi:peptidyl-prolyl cis-trans isomerase SurA
MRNLALLVLLAAVPVAGAQTRPAPPTPPAAPAPVTLVATGADLPVDRIAAVVGTKPIMFSEVLESVFERRAQGQLQFPADSAGQAAVARQVLGELVDEEILVQKATEAKTEVSEDEVNTTAEGQFKQIRARFPTESQFRAELQKAGRGSPDDLRRELREQTRRQLLVQRHIQKLREENKLAGGTVTEEEIRRDFESRKATAQKRPATVGFRQIMLTPAPSKAARDRALAKAESLLVELRKGGNFELIAKRESMDPGSKELGGDLGWHRRGEMVSEFNDVMFALSPGQLSRPVETAFGFHIIRVDRVQPAEVKVRHILITPTIDSADVEATRVRADSVYNAWKGGADFNALAATYHDRRGGEQSVIPEVAQDSLPASYATAIAGRKQGDILAPFPIPGVAGRPTKFALAQITLLSAGGDFEFAEVRNRIRETLAQQKGMQRMLAGLRESVYVSLRL